MRKMNPKVRRVALRIHDIDRDVAFTWKHVMKRVREYSVRGLRRRAMRPDWRLRCWDIPPSRDSTYLRRREGRRNHFLTVSLRRESTGGGHDVEWRRDLTVLC